MPSNIAVQPGQKLGRTPFRKEFIELYSDLASDERNNPFRPSRHYLQVGDLRAFGFDVVAHLNNKHGEGNHKIEFVDIGLDKTGKQGLGMSRVVGELQQIVDMDPLKLGVMRYDAAADVEDVSVAWFQQRARVRWKRFANEIGKYVFEDLDGKQVLEYSQMGSRGIETLYFGKRPNCFRIYNKIEEWKHQYRRTFRKRDLNALVKRMTKAGATAEDIAWHLAQENVNPEAEDSAPPSFASMYGVPEHGYVLTRAERQIGGGRIPEQVGTLGDIINGGIDFNPYADMEIIQGGAAEPVPEHYQLLTYMAGMYLRQRIEAEGMEQTRKWMNRHQHIQDDGSISKPGRNAKRILEKTLKDFVPVDNGFEGDGLITPEALYEQYRYTLSKQLAA